MGINDWVSDKKPVLKFIVYFVAIASLSFLVFYSFQRQFLWLNRTTAQLLANTLSLLGFKATAAGVSVTVSGLTLQIIDECTALFSLIVFTSVVLAYRASVRQKALGLILGLPALLLLNLLRLVFLTIIGIHYPSLFDYLHYYLWQSTFIIFVLLLFLIWIKKVVA